ncbi:Dehydrogenase/reductase SDR family member 4 [Hondaea fermentalgiana]|uniref:Dehydrogenase/reductase SDR family member 4 n=1 Tax=Hondaea fermentalgiana TaxID=2315210 RepID=A0A2R5GUJ2_9STRA|nr:Dehydrogenase/reductase SDR family member 4 [Hondaea fermentalgiana]|eukprot:GBG34522.1 Dehydrogenase/reductase SDR family member 4 [Hondaea fermentalgiana]
MATAAMEGAGAGGTSAAETAEVDFLFDGKVVMVTGAGGNFGRAGGVYFAKSGADVVLCDVAEGPLKEAEEEVKTYVKEGRRVMAITCDITDAEKVKEVVDNVVGTLGRIDHLWNNAGYQGLMKPTHEYPVEDFARVMNINVVGSFCVLQAVAKSMIDKGIHGTIVNTASVAALRGTPTMSAYASSKAAIITLTISTAKDLAPYNIRVNAVSPALIGPGHMWTRQNTLHAESGSPYFSRDADEVAAAKVNSVPMKRLGTIDEVVQSVAFLLSRASSYTTGTNLVIAGGLA